MTTGDFVPTPNPLYLVDSIGRGGAIRTPRPPVPKAVFGSQSILPVFKYFHFKQFWLSCGNEWNGLELGSFGSYISIYTAGSQVGALLLAKRVKFW